MFFVVKLAILLQMFLFSSVCLCQEMPAYSIVFWVLQIRMYSIIFENKLGIKQALIHNDRIILHRVTHFFSKITALQPTVQFLAFLWMDG